MAYFLKKSNLKKGITFRFMRVFMTLQKSRLHTGLTKPSAM